MNDRMLVREGLKPQPISAMDLGIGAAKSCGADAAGFGGMDSAQGILSAVNDAIEACVLDQTQDDHLDGKPTPSGGSGGGLFGGGPGAEDSGTSLWQKFLDAIDPNELIGLSGFGPNHAIERGRSLSYEVMFENLAAAGLPAQVVTVEGALDPTFFDLTSFVLEEVRVGEEVHPFYLGDPSGVLDIPVDDDLAIHLETTLSPDGDLHFTLGSIDRATGLPTEQSLSGFLPPNKTPPQGQGALRYRVALRDDTPANTLIPNQASIIFDSNEPIHTNVWAHVIDEAPPTTTVTPVDSPYQGTELTVSWAGDDDIGAGVHFYEIFLATEGEEPSLVKTTSETSLTLDLTDISSLELTVTATDWLDNRESKSSPDLTLTIVPPSPSPSPSGSGDSGSCQTSATPQEMPWLPALVLLLGMLGLRSRRWA
jgi:MYXO-CTERM domain-containing protein